MLATLWTNSQELGELLSWAGSQAAYATPERASSASRLCPGSSAAPSSSPAHWLLLMPFKIARLNTTCHLALGRKSPS